MSKRRRTDAKPSADVELPPQQPQPKPRLRRKPPRVRAHASGRWTVCIGKRLNKDGSKLVPRDFYFGGTEAAANAAAARVAAKWALIVRTWAATHQPTLRTLGERFADVPHWPREVADEARPRKPSAADVAAFANRPPTRDELAEAHADVTLGGVVGLYKIELQKSLADADIQRATQWTDAKNLRGALAFFDAGKPLAELSGSDVERARSAMLAKLSRRTASNYLAAVKGALSWFYASDYGRDFDKPSNFDAKKRSPFFVGKATRTDVDIPSVERLRTLLAAASPRQRLFALLGLNCGMYQADVGRLALAEVDLSAGFVFWDREKQPSNAFRVRHDFWPETLALVRRFVQPSGTKPRTSDDYRGATAVRVDCSTLAFVYEAGLPLYRVRETGKAYDKVDKAWRAGLAERSDFAAFKSLRKATNQILRDALNEHVDDGGGDAPQLVAVDEISRMFLGQKTDELVRVYETRGVNGFGRMNAWLAKVGDRLRSAGVFDWGE